MRHATVLLAASLAASVSAQDPGERGEDYFRKKGRGDVHSKGWDEVMRLRGAPVTPQFPAVGDRIERHVLDNGLVVYVAEDHRLPIVKLDLHFRGGELHEALPDWGAAGLAGSQMRDGGTAAMTPEQLDDRLAFLAAQVNTGMGEESGSASLDVLTQHLDEGLAIFADVVLRPRFDEERLAVAKRRRVFGLLHQNDEPGQIVSREIATLVYGEAHPRGRRWTPERVEAIDRDDLVRAHRRFVRPNHAFLAVTGDFTTADMLAKIEKSFGAWEKGDALPAKLPKSTLIARPGVFLVDKAVNQSHVVIAHAGMTRDDPDRFEVDVMNDILGGGSFVSRVTERVRSDEGLAYSARTSYDIAGREVGTFRASVQTKSATTGRAVDLILEEIARIRTERNVSRNEFETARDAILHSYVFRFEDFAGNVTRLMRYEMDGRPADTDRQSHASYLAVTPAEVEAAAVRRLRPDDLTILVVGDAKVVKPQLEKLGPVTMLPLVEFTAPPTLAPPIGAGQ